MLEHGSVTMYLTGRLPVARPRADPAPALLLQPAVAAVRARAGRHLRRAGGHRRGPGAARGASSPRPTPRWPPTPTCSRGWRRSFDDVPNATLRRKQALQAARSVLPTATETRHRRHRQLPGLAALHRDAGQRARRRRDPPSSRSPACASCSGWRRTSSRTSGSAPWPTARRSPPARTSPRAELLRGPEAGAARCRGRPYPRAVEHRGNRRHPVRGPPPAHPRARHAEAGPHRHRHGQPVRRAAALRPVRALPAGDDEEGALQVDRRRAAVVPPRRQQRRLAAEQRRHHLGRVGRRRRASSARSTACSGGRGRRRTASRSTRSAACWTRCAPTPTRAA